MLSPGFSLKLLDFALQLSLSRKDLCFVKFCTRQFLNEARNVCVYFFSTSLVSSHDWHCWFFVIFAALRSQLTAEVIILCDF